MKKTHPEKVNTLTRKESKEVQAGLSAYDASCPWLCDVCHPDSCVKGKLSQLDAAR